jgi:hypothetical protein
MHAAGWSKSTETHLLENQWTIEALLQGGRGATGSLKTSSFLFRPCLVLKNFTKYE